MADIDSADFSDIKLAGSDFSFTGNLAKFAVNDEWVDGYRSLVDANVKKNGFTSMWQAVSSGSEDAGNAIYETLRNYINDIGNIDTCGIDALKNYAEILGFKSDYLNVNISFPIEIKNLIEIFSVNPAYLYNKATDGSDDTLVLSNSILHHSTVEQFISALKDKNLFRELVNNVFYNTLLDFLNLKTTTFDDSVNGIKQVEIWKTDSNRFVNHLWGDDITSDKEIYSLKESLGVNKSFTEKVYADDIISGKKKLSDFSDVEQSVINAEIKSRETRYGDADSMRYYYMRLFKVVEYFRFATIAYNSSYELRRYEINDNKYSIISNSDNRLSILKFDYSGYDIDLSAIKRVSEWLSNLCFGVRSSREDMKTQCHKNVLVGTKRLIVDIVRKFILEKIDGDVLNDVRDSILYSAGLNRKFGVSIIEYSDMTEYFNIENPNDAVDPSKHGLRSRYWEMYDDCGNAFTNDEVLAFYNRLFGDSKKFIKNSAEGKDSGSDNLYEFLSILFESGATQTANSDYYLSSDVYVADGGSKLFSYGKYTLSKEDKDKIAKYAGDMNFGTIPYANYKNSFHPSYQMHPFIQAFEEYNEAYTSVMNLVNAYTENINESFSRLKDRLDSLGNTINFWYNWNDDFSGYSTTYEKTGSDFDMKTAQDGPFNFDALQSYVLNPGEYINNILNGVNGYYYNTETGKSLLTDDEIRIEVARLQKYKTMILGLAKREIFKYGKDHLGNIYILYKDESEGGKNRRNRNAIGDVWVRLRNHPIAFPLFDISLSPVKFNNTSCISESDNSKLLSVLTKTIAFFKKSYGKHYYDKSIQDGSIDMGGLTLSVNTYSETTPITTGGWNGMSSFEFKYDGNEEERAGEFRISQFNSMVVESFVDAPETSDMTIYDVPTTKELSSVSETYYFVDSVTGEKIRGGLASTFVVSSEGGGVDPNPTGCIVSQPDIKFFNSEYDYANSTFVVNPNVSIFKRLVFAKYSDENSFDGNHYYCVNSITGNRHPCTKRKVVFEKLFSLPLDALSGSVDSVGNVSFGGKIQEKEIKSGTYATPFSKYVVDSDVVSSSTSVLDGGLVYEDFSRFQYYVVNGGRSKNVPVTEIVIVGGNNPYHVTRDESGNLMLEKAYINGNLYDSDAIQFSDSIYRTNVDAPATLSSFEFSACEFVKKYGDGYSDTIGQFYLRGNPYTLYQPFTELSGNPTTEPALLDAESPTGAITLYGDDENVTFYYNLKYFTKDNVRRHVVSKYVRYDSHMASVSVTSCKFGGSIELFPYDSVEYPTYLDFNSSGVDNFAKYSSYMTEMAQQKFFDIGFSYNQKIMYLSYTNGSEEYLDGGTIVGKMDENYDENYNSTLSFHRDSSHNVEYVDSQTSFLKGEGYDTFHIGDVSSKLGVFTVYGKYDNSSKSLEISVTLFSVDDVRSKKFGIDVKNGLYEFDSGSRYSFSVSCTDDRLYISFTIKPPDKDEIISNTVNGVTGGIIGSTKFGEVSSAFSDCMIQIISLDITDDEMEYLPSETRFILAGGEIGYFQQFSGISGRNNMFSNGKLSKDYIFPIQPQFGEVSGDSNIEFLHTYESEIDGYSSDRNIRTFDRYVNLTPYTFQSDEISGFLIEDNHKKAIYSVAKPIEKSGGDDSSKDVGRSVEFESIGGRGIIDVTRGLDGNGYDGIVQTFEKLYSLQNLKLGDRYMVIERSDSESDGGYPNSLYEYIGKVDVNTASVVITSVFVQSVKNLSETTEVYEPMYFIDVGETDKVQIYDGSLIRFEHDLDGYERGFYTASIASTSFSDEVDGNARIDAEVKYDRIDLTGVEFDNYSDMPLSAEYDGSSFSIETEHGRIEVFDGKISRVLKGSVIDGKIFGEGLYLMTVESVESEDEHGDTYVEYGKISYSRTETIDFGFGSNGMWKYVDSRPNHGVNVISDGLDKYNRCAAFVDSTDVDNPVDVMDKKLVLIPIHSNSIGYTRFDFDELVDRDNSFISLHSDGNTISFATISSYSGEFNPVSGIIEYEFIPYGIVGNVSELSGYEEDGRVMKVESDECNYRYELESSEWKKCEISKISTNDIKTVNFVNPLIFEDGYSKSSTSGGRKCFGIYNGGVSTFFGAYGGKNVIQYKPNLVYPEYGCVQFFMDDVPMVLYPTSRGTENGATQPYLEYGGSVIVSDMDSYVAIPLSTYFSLQSYSLKFAYGETIENIIDTSYPEVKLISTSFGNIYRFDVKTGKMKNSHTFDELNSKISIDSIADFKCVISETKEHIMISYGSESRNIHGVLRTRKNTPDSIAEPVMFVGEDGYSIESINITKFLSLDDVVLAEESGGYRIFISKDDGSTFKVMSSRGGSMKLIGCGSVKFYARYGNDEKVFSTDGENWINVKNIHSSNWSIFNASGIDYIACETVDSDIKDGVLETDKFILIEKQMKIDNGRKFDKIRLDSELNIICISGMDGKDSLLIARSFFENGEYSEFEYVEYPFIRNMKFGSAVAVGKDLLLSPFGGMSALLISDAFNRGSSTSTKFIDISNSVSNEINVFGGFGYANGRLLMYPSDGRTILSYDSANGRFHSIYSFDDVMTLCDCDSINFEDDSDAILSPRSSSMNGRIKFSRTGFDDRKDYGIVEIDEGFPILVTYCSLSSNFDDKDETNGVTGDVFKIKFDFINDDNRKSVSILSRPRNLSGPGLEDFDFDKWNSSGYDVCETEGVYIVNGRSIKYVFHSVDSSNKFVIEKKFSDYSTSLRNNDCLEIMISFNNESDRDSAKLEYELARGSGRMCVYGDISDDDNIYNSEL